MSLENNKEKREQAESVQKEQKQSYIREVFKLIDEIPVGKIFSIALLYSFSFFIIPYFVYYKFAPIDLSISYIPIKMIILIIITALYFSLIVSLLLLSPMIFLSTLKSYEMHKNWDYSILGSLIIVILIIYFLFSYCIYFSDSSLVLKYIAFITLLFFYFLMDILISSCHPYYSNIINSALVRMFTVFLFLAGNALVSFIFFENWSLVETIISSLVFSGLMSFIALIVYINDKNKMYIPLIAVFMIPSILLTLSGSNYIRFLEGVYSLVGVTSHRNVVCINKSYPFLIVGSYKQVDIKSINAPTYNKTEDFVCYKDLKIIWNGDSSIWIASNQNKYNKYQPIISIPKKYLLNNDIINYVARPQRNTKENKKPEESQTQTQGNGARNTNSLSKEADTEKTNPEE